MPQLDFSSSFPIPDSPASPTFDVHDDEMSDGDVDVDHLSDAGSEAWSDNDAGSEAWSDTAESTAPLMSMPSVLSIDNLSASRVTESVSGWVDFSLDLLGHIQDDSFF